MTNINKNHRTPNSKSEIRHNRFLPEMSKHLITVFCNIKSSTVTSLIHLRCENTNSFL